MAFSVTVLGCASPFPRPGEPCSGYLVQTEEVRLLVDCGSGILAALQHQIDLPELTAVWFSHLDPDHSSDLLVVFNWLTDSPESGPLPIYGPPGWADRLIGMLPSAHAAKRVHQAFDVHELHHGHHANISGLALTSAAVEHNVPAYGLRLEHQGHTVSYSGDTAPCPALTALARDTDLFICEAGTSQPNLSHCTPQEAGLTARQAGAKRLLITHVPEPDQRQKAADIAGRAFGGPTEAAQPGALLTIADGPRAA